MKKTLLVALLTLAIGAAAGYYFGYDHGWEKALEWQGAQPGALGY